ncbi:MAG: hypothetical protein AB7H43_04335 [Acidimicrobiia bacterium]
MTGRANTGSGADERPGGPHPDDRHEWLSFEDPGEARTWLFDVTFLLSRWTCIFAAGCKGVLTEEAPELVHGCCSYGAHFVDDADRDATVAAAATLTADEWQFRRAGRRKGVVTERDGAWTTHLHKGACIFLNRPDFEHGAGCALHLAALRRGLHHMTLKPEVCWQLPLRRVDSTDELGHVTSTLREWKRRDWGEGGEEFAWWCTESGDAFVGGETVLSSMAEELRAMVGPVAHDLLLAALAERTGAPLPHPAVPVAPPVARPSSR